MNILNFFNTYGLDAALVIVGVFVLLYIVYLAKNNKKLLSLAALELVARAEKEYGGKTGEIKYATVAGQLYRRIPVAFRPFVSEAVLGELVDKAVKQLQKALQDGATLDSYFVENYIEGADPGSPGE